MSVLVIAEPGGTHEGRLGAMFELVTMAAEAGADCFKSQWVSDPALLAARRHAPEYLDSYRLLAYPLAWHQVLLTVCRDLGIQYGCTAYLPGDATLLAPYIDILKISSFESEDHVLFNEAVTLDVRVIASDGMSRGEPPAYATDVEWLHCVSAYPAPLAELNLDVLRDQVVPKYVGFSDHSRDVRVGAWAACAGASIIETHVRLDTCQLFNRDYAVAFAPHEFEQYVQNIRDAEVALGTGVKRVMPCEAPMLRYRAR